MQQHTDKLRIALAAPVTSRLLRREPGPATSPIDDPCRGGGRYWGTGRPPSAQHVRGECAVPGGAPGSVGALKQILRRVPESGLRGRSELTLKAGRDSWVGGREPAQQLV